MSKSVIYSLSLALLASVFVFSSTGCRKKGKTIALISVRNSNNEPVAGAMVRLYGQSTTNPPSGPVVRIDTAYTDSAGIAKFDYTEVFQLGQAGLFVLNIEARKGLLTGAGIVKIVEETTTEERVFIQ
jgi:hypothetical protein